MNDLQRELQRERRAANAILWVALLAYTVGIMTGVTIMVLGR